MSQSITRKINPGEPEPEIIAEAAGVVKKGGVVVFPTRCLYGLGADAMNPAAVERIIEIKQRPEDNPILVLIDSKDQLEMLVRKIPPPAGAIMKAFWPGRVTLVFDARDTLPDLLTARTGKIGVRLAGHPVAAAMLRKINGPVTGTSANLSGRPGCSCLADLDPQITGRVDLFLDAGTLQGGVGSTVVDVTEEPPRILREGEITARQIRGALTAIYHPS
jgi:L-threonylcarbamoyladenylate synthase